jgi:hypothetical protein
MQTTADIVLALKDRYNCSWYKVGKMLDIDPGRVYTMRAGKQIMSKKVAAKAALLLDREPAELIMITEAERTKDDQIRASFHRLLKRASAAILLLSFTLSAPYPAVSDALNCIFC